MIFLYLSDLKSDWAHTQCQFKSGPGQLIPRKGIFIFRIWDTGGTVGNKTSEKITIK